MPPADHPSPPTTAPATASNPAGRPADPGRSVDGAPHTRQPGSLLNLLAAAGPLTGAALVAVALLVLWATWQVLQPLPERRLVLATGPEQGAYAEFARRYQPLLQAQGLQVELRSSQGSGENLALLRDPRSGVHAAFVQGGALQGEGGTTGEAAGLASMGQVALEPLWLFYREDRIADGRPAGAAARRSPDRTWPTVMRAPAPQPPERLSQLAGWRIDTGPPGGGSGLLMRQLASESGLPLHGLQSSARPVALSVADLVQGKVDAVALVSAADAPLVQYLLATPGVRLMSLVQAPAHERRHAYLRALVLPRGTADPAADQPGRDTQLVATQATLAVRDDLHPALMQLLLQAAQQVHGGPGWFHRAGDFPHAGSDELPLADEAARFHRDGPPWLQRHLPFWLAHGVDRMWIVLLPLLAAL